MAESLSPSSPVATSLGSPAATTDTAGPELARIKYGAAIIGAAFVLLGIIFGIAVSRYTAASDITAAVGAIATVVGTIVGAFFGVQAGSSGKAAAEAGRASAEAGRANAEAERSTAERKAEMALAKLDPRDAEDVLSKL